MGCSSSSWSIPSNKVIQEINKVGEFILEFIKEVGVYYVILFLAITVILKRG